MRYFTLQISEYSSIQEAMNAIPAGETHLDLSDNYLGERSGAYLAAALSGIPRSVTRLDLGWNSLGSKSRAELAAIFASIPAGITYLNLHGNNLARLSGADLKTAISGIPRLVTHLDLSSNILGNLSGAALEAVFASIPRSVTHLDLGGNKLVQRSGAELAVAFARIPDSVTHLNLTDNDLGSKSGAELVAAFAKIPESVTSLDLELNKLDDLSGAELAAALSGIPRSVTRLDLGWNSLGPKSRAELAAIFASIPAGVTDLNLRNNNLGERSGAYLAAAFTWIPRSVTDLFLCNNDLYRLAGDDLAKLLAFIPNTVKEVSLADNYLTSKPEAYLKEAFSGLPKGTMISFKGERIFTPGNREANDALLKKLRSAAAGRNLCLINTGESDFWRGLSTLVGLSKQVVPTGAGITDIPIEMIHYIASFLVSPVQVQELTTLLKSNIMARVMGRESENSNQKACIVNTLDLSEAGLSRLTVPQLQAIFADMSWHIRKVILSDEDVIEILKQAEAKEALKFLPPNMIIKLMTNDTDLLKDALVKLEEAVANEVLSLKVEKAYLRPNNALLFNMEAPKEDAIDLRARAAG